LDQKIAGLLERTFTEGRTYEVIVTTMRDRGQGPPNAAAIGVVRRGQFLTMKVFKGSDTFDNLLAMKRLGINVITGDHIDMLAMAALRGWGSTEAEFGPEQYEDIRELPVLKFAAIQIDCAVEEWAEKDGKDDYGHYHNATFNAIPQAYRVKDENGRPIERGTKVVLEALVFATRWKVAEGELKQFLWQRLKVYIQKALDLGGEANLKALGLINDFLAKG
jgi:hypothetical protein